MKKQILGCFAIIIFAATAISATKTHPVSANISSYSIVADTTPHKMHQKKNYDSSKWHKNKMDTSMNHMNRDSSNL